MGEIFVVVCHLIGGRCDIVDPIACKTLYKATDDKQASQICHDRGFVIIAHADGNKTETE